MQSRSGQLQLLLLIVLALIFGLIGGFLGVLVARQQVARQPAPTALPPAQAATTPTPQTGLSPAVANLQAAVKEVVAQDNPAVVNIHVEKEMPALPQEIFPFPFQFGPPGPEKAQGSGFFFDKEGHVLTNSHVVEGMDKIEVSLANGKAYPAKLVGIDHESDTAVLKVDLKGTSQPYLELGDSNDLAPGDFVLAMGNPFGYENSVTMGIVSALHRQSVRVDNRIYRDLIQTDAAINPGNSGGPLVTLDGKVVGINTVIYSPSGASVGIGFAIPINQVKKILNDLLTKGHVERPAMGVIIDDVTPQAKEYFNFPGDKGAVISAVMPKSPAQKAGLRPGDIITEIDHHQINGADDVVNLLKNYKPGQEIMMKVFSKGKFEYVKVKLTDKSKLSFGRRR